MATRCVLIIGRVQGVGFRSFVDRIARQLNINGEVWNRYDGSVEVIVQSDEPQSLQDFLDKMQFGPGRVDRVLSSEFNSRIEYDRFRIGPTR